MDDDTLEAPHDRGPRNAVIAAVVCALGGVGAWIAHDHFDQERRTRELQRASEAWSDLSRCLAGEHPRVGEIARNARRAELRVPASVRGMTRDERSREWPWRCAPPARILTRALFDSRSDDPAHRILNQYASLAATELGRGALRASRDDARRYLDELFAAASRANLPPARASTVPLPPEPMRVLEPSRVRPLFRGAGSASLVADEPLDAGALRVVVGRTERRLCDFDRTLEWPECARVAALDHHVAVHLTSARYPAMPGYLADPDARGVGALLHPATPDGAAIEARASDAWRASRDVWVTAVAPDATRFEVRDGSLSLPLGTFATPFVAGPRMMGEVFVAALTAPAPPATPDGGVALFDEPLVAGAVSSEAPRRWVSTPSPRATVRVSAAGLTVRGCALDDARAVVAWGDDAHAVVLWFRNGSFVSARTIDAGHGTLSCHGGTLRLAWYSPLPFPKAHVTTCTEARCTHAEATAPMLDAPPRVVAMGERVLLVYTGDELGGLRYRYGPLATIADARETVIFDDAAHDGIDLEAPPTVLAHDDLAAILVTRKGAPYETWGLRVDADGYRAMRQRE
jgi:hypothetical protein